MSFNNSLDDVLGSGGGQTAFLRETPIGTTFRGPIIDASIAQVKDFLSQKPMFWDDGNPRQQIVVRIQTDLRNDEDDDGIRALYIKCWGDQRTALKEAQAEGRFSRLSEALAPGNIFSDTYYADKPASTPGMSPTKMHRYEITRGSSPALDGAVQQPAPAQQYQQPAPAQQYQQPAPVAAAPAPVAAPAPAAAPPADDALSIAKQMIALGLPDNVIEAQTGLASVVIAALRGQAAA